MKSIDDPISWVKVDNTSYYLQASSCRDRTTVSSKKLLSIVRNYNVWYVGGAQGRAVPPGEQGPPPAGGCGQTLRAAPAPPG